MRMGEEFPSVRRVKRVRKLKGRKEEGGVMAPLERGLEVNGFLEGIFWHGRLGTPPLAGHLPNFPSFSLHPSNEPFLPSSPYQVSYLILTALTNVLSLLPLSSLGKLARTLQKVGRVLYDDCIAQRGDNGDISSRV